MWHSAATPPRSGQHVLVVCAYDPDHEYAPENAYVRTGIWMRRYTENVIEDGVDPDDEWTEYDEAARIRYYTEGWYTQTRAGYMEYSPIGAHVTHWQALPTLPED